MTDDDSPASFDRSSGYDPPTLVLPPYVSRRPPPVESLRWLVMNFVYPQLLWILVAAVAWNFATPDVSRMATLEVGWVLNIYVRNVALLLLVVGGLHMHLHIRKGQGKEYKYDSRWLATDRKRFLFSNQTRENMFWSLGSGALLATAFEALVLWALASERVPSTTWSAAPIWIAVVTVAVFWIQAAHFYALHRLLHWDPLYKFAHSLHHKNINTGPWSGLSMHPFEHLLYFSLPLVFLVIPASPFVVTFSVVYSMLGPAGSHSGFDRLVIRESTSIPLGDFYHDLHHRYFECNYGVTIVPFDKWFGTYHDGSAEAHELMKERRRAARRV